MFGIEARAIVFNTKPKITADIVQRHPHRRLRRVLRGISQRLGGGNMVIEQAQLTALAAKRWAMSSCSSRAIRARSSSMAVMHWCDSISVNGANAEGVQAEVLRPSFLG